jgi:hypothetical protein
MHYFAKIRAGSVIDKQWRAHGAVAGTVHGVLFTIIAGASPKSNGTAPIYFSGPLDMGESESFRLLMHESVEVETIAAAPVSILMPATIAVPEPPESVILATEPQSIDAEVVTASVEIVSPAAADALQAMIEKNRASAQVDPIQARGKPGRKG